MNKRKFLPLWVLGSLLILAALCLALVFSLRLARVNRESRQLLTRLDALLPEGGTALPQGAMPVLELEDRDYVAVLELPSQGLRLPVQNSWQGKVLPHLPGRFSGSAYDRDLVLGGFDHRTQFGFCGKVDLGEKVILTDMTGARFSYTVTGVDRSAAADGAWLRGQADLTLFCRDLSSNQYIAVRCALTP